MGNEGQSKRVEGSVQTKPLEENENPTNDPRPLGCLKHRENILDTNEETEDSPTNDPRPLGSHPPAVPAHKETAASWKNPVEEVFYVYYTHKLDVDVRIYLQFYVIVSIVG